MARLLRAGRLPRMLTPHRSSRVLLLASGRSAAEAGTVPVRRYRLARVRVSPGAATAAPPAARIKRG